MLHDTDRPEWRPLLNVMNQLVWSADGRGVHTVFVDGRMVVEAGRMTTIDEDALWAAAQAGRRGDHAALRPARHGEVPTVLTLRVTTSLRRATMVRRQRNGLTISPRTKGENRREEQAIRSSHQPSAGGVGRNIDHRRGMRQRQQFE